jgi:glycosyltransferase involved in cell wall biosynthesis
MDNYFITVNSEQYIRDYALRFKISVKKFFLLNDPFQEKDIREFKYQRSYIFVGGEAQRDWDTLFQAAQHLPEIKFVCVARKKYFKSNLFIPSNVTLLFDLDSKSFYEYMDNSSIVVIPLKSELPAGLIILLKAASMRKPIIATATPAISNYIINEESGLLFKKGNVLELVEAINKLYFDEKKQEYFSNKLLDNVMFDHSPSKYTERLIEIITKLEANNNILMFRS